MNTVCVLALLAACVGTLQAGLSRPKTASAPCGVPAIPPVEDRIIGGEDARPYSWPWQAAFCFIGYPHACSLQCGATLVGNRWAMTAAHCVFAHENDPDLFSVHMGVYYYDASNETGDVTAYIEKIHRNPNFSHPTDNAYDIALLQLKRPVEYTSHISPVCLPNSDAQGLKAGNTAYVTGWGKQQDGEVSDTLKQVAVPIDAQTTCDSDYTGEIDDKTMFCAGTVGKDSCQGDSGGPLVVKESEVWYQHGIVSWGHGCAMEGYPGVYSRVSAYCDWIQSTTQGEVNCVSV